MRALLSHRAGGPETLVLEDVPEPAVGPGEVRIAVRACGVNFPDLLIIQDLYQYKPPRPFIPGGEVAGIVEAVGEGVDKVQPGDRVLMSPVQGGMAQKAVGAAAAVCACAARPNDINVVAAAPASNMVRRFMTWPPPMAKRL